DRLVADEFSRSFKDQFFEDFGWKHKQRQDVFKSAVRTSPRVAPDVSRSILRSALYGLTRFPQVAVAHLEQIARIRVENSDLRRWRDAIGEAVISNPHLSQDGITALLEAHVLPQTLQQDIKSDLRFGFARSKTPEEQAQKQLRVLINFLDQDQSLRE